MPLYICIITIVVLIVVIGANNNEKNNLYEENKRLKNQLYDLKHPKEQESDSKEIKPQEQQGSTGQNVDANPTVNPEPVKETSKAKSYSEPVPQYAVETKSDANSTKNNVILITGAIFIILAAIVFLGSTWNVISSPIKSLIMFLFIFIFLGASYIAEKKFNLVKTGKTFFYIAMAYIPILFTSLWVFGIIKDLFDEALINSFAYFSGVFLITGIIYYAFSRIKKSRVLFYLSVVSGLFAVVCFALIFTKDEVLVNVAICLYSLLVTLIAILSNKLDDYDIKLALKIMFWLSFVSSFFVYSMLVSRGESSLNIYKYSNYYYLCSLLSIVANSLLIYLRVENKNIYVITYLISIYSTILYPIVGMKINLNMEYLLLLGTLLTIGISSLNENQILKKNEKSSLLVPVNIGITLIYLALIFLLGFVGTIFAGIPSYLLPVLCVINVAYLFIQYSHNKGYIVYKYLCYIYSYFAVYSFMNMFKVSFEIISILIMLWTIVLYLLETRFKQYRDDGSEAFFVVMQSLSYLMLSAVNTIVSLSFGLFSATVLFVLNILKKENKYLRIAPMAGALLIIGNIGNQPFEFCLTIRLIYGLLLTGYTIYNRKVSAETIFAGIGILMLASLFDNVYIRLAIMLLWEVICLIFVESEKHKDVFKGLIYITSLSLYINYINTTWLKEWSSAFKIPIVLVALLYLKTIIKKHVKDIQDRDLIDYLTLGLIYISSLVSYSSEYDGMIFCLFVLLLLIYCYQRKHGAIFITSTIALIINALFLTRMFWASIPWWGYLLLIGIVLIGFAIRNESKENKGLKDVGSKIKQIKENIDNKG